MCVSMCIFYKTEIMPYKVLYIFCHLVLYCRQFFRLIIILEHDLQWQPSSPSDNNLFQLLSIGHLYCFQFFFIAKNTVINSSPRRIARSKAMNFYKAVGVHCWITLRTACTSLSSFHQGVSFVCQSEKGKSFCIPHNEHLFVIRKKIYVLF